MSYVQLNILTFRQWIALIACALLFSLIFIQMNIFNSLTPILEKETHFTLRDLSYLSSALSWGNVIGLLFSGKIIDNYPIKPTLTITSASLAVATLIFSFATSYITLLSSRFIMGICGAFCFIGPIRYFHLVGRGNKLSFIISLIGFVGCLGGVISQKYLLIWFEHVHWRHVILYLALINIGILVVQMSTLSKIKYTKTLESCQKISFKTILSNYGVLNYISYAVIMNFSISIIGAFWGNQFLTKVYHLTLSDAATLSSSIFWGHLVCTPIINLFINERNKTILIKLAPLIAIFVFSLICIQTPPSFNLLFIALFILGGSSAVLPMVYSSVAKKVPSNITATATSLISIGLFIASGIIQPLIGLLVQHNWSTGFEPTHTIFSILISVFILAFAISIILKPENPC
jgi:MFS family permease